MPGKVSITVGLPGSGKTRVAKLMHADNPDDVILVSRDGLRAELFNGEGILSSHEENYITKVQKGIVKDAVRVGKHVIIHDTNLRERYRTQWAKIAAAQGAEFEIIDLTSVDPGICITRDANRSRRVGHKVIEELYEKFIVPLNGRSLDVPQTALSLSVSFEPYVPDLTLPKAIIVDVDGTVADCTGVRSPYDYSRVSLDRPKKDVIQLVKNEAYDLGTKILFVSGRLAPVDSQCYNDTLEWLYKHVKVPVEMLAMREVDGVDDTVVKYNIFDKLIRDRYNAKYSLDDRNRVVSMWRSINLLCLQVAEGDF